MTMGYSSMADLARIRDMKRMTSWSQVLVDSTRSGDGEMQPIRGAQSCRSMHRSVRLTRVIFSTPYFGIHMNSGNEANPWRGKNSMYRLHIEDPIHFRESIRVTIKHGHANKLGNDYSSTAYWYQTEPHEPFPKMLPIEQRLPRP